MMTVGSKVQVLITETENQCIENPHPWREADKTWHFLSAKLSHTFLWL
jgi:hypothetical protein